VLRGLERLEIGADVDVEKLPVNLKKALGVGETWKLRKIVRFDLRQTRRPDFGHACGFVEGKAARQARFLEFFAETFDCHGGKDRLDGSVEIDKDLARFRTLTGTQNTSLFQNINDAGGARVSQAEPALQQ
jgi:hypothetical protein